MTKIKTTQQRKDEAATHIFKVYGMELPFRIMNYDYLGFFKVVYTYSNVRREPIFATDDFKIAVDNGPYIEFYPNYETIREYKINELLK